MSRATTSRSATSRSTTIRSPVIRATLIRSTLIFLAAAGIGLQAGCVTTTLAPGAASVRLVKNQADVASCKPMGNVRRPADDNVDIRNLTVGLGGDTLFVTEDVLGSFVKAGIAYQCGRT